MIYARPGTAWESLPRLTQVYLITMGIGFTGLVIFGIINAIRERRKSRVLAQEEALRRLRPVDRERS
jgi:hypothetical protein